VVLKITDNLFLVARPKGFAADPDRWTLAAFSKAVRSMKNNPVFQKVLLEELLDNLNHFFISSRKTRASEANGDLGLVHIHRCCTIIVSKLTNLDAIIGILSEKVVKFALS
jgi:hypothetical protein